MLDYNSRVWMWYKQSTQPLKRGQLSQLFTWMYNSAPAISRDLRAGNKRKAVVYCTQESWTQDKSQSKQRRMESAIAQLKQHALTFNVMAAMKPRVCVARKRHPAPLRKQSETSAKWTSKTKEKAARHKTSWMGLGAASCCKTFGLEKREPERRQKQGERD